ncbi:hypothetical protein PWG14_28135, partial [Chromobacterium amazonense]|uniref:hypothetical protein n=1 Tax=Chromobacterium amazonense TaxID=1382803 RepID=UPI00237D83CB
LSVGSELAVLAVNWQFLRPIPPSWQFAPASWQCFSRHCQQLNPYQSATYRPVGSVGSVGSGFCYIRKKKDARFKINRHII